MENILLASDSKTPKVSFDAQTGILEMKGRSIPENSYQFYAPLLAWLEEYILEPQAKTVFTLKLDYFNTSSSMYILGILRKLEKLHLAGHAAEVHWYYEEDDDEMLETGKDLMHIVKVPIHMIVGNLRD